MLSQVQLLVKLVNLVLGLPSLCLFFLQLLVVSCLDVSLVLPFSVELLLHLSDLSLQIFLDVIKLLSHLILLFKLLFDFFLERVDTFLVLFGSQDVLLSFLLALCQSILG